MYYNFPLSFTSCLLHCSQMDVSEADMRARLTVVAEHEARTKAQEPPPPSPQPGKGKGDKGTPAPPPSHHSEAGLLRRLERWQRLRQEDADDLAAQVGVWGWTDCVYLSCRSARACFAHHVAHISIDHGWRVAHLDCMRD